MMDLLCYFSSKNIFYIDTGVGGGGGGERERGRDICNEGAQNSISPGAS